MNKQTVKVSLGELLQGKNNLNFNLSIQRNTVWKDEQKDLLIHSILTDFHINLLHAEVKDGVRYFMDGKQRLFATIIPFVEGNYRTTKTAPSVEGFSLVDLTYDQLPEDLKNKFLSFMVDIEEYYDLSDKDRAEIFRRINNGTPLTSIEKTRAKAERVTQLMNNVSQTEFFTNKVFISEKSKNRFDHNNVILQILAIFLDQAMEFSGAKLDAFAMELNETGVSEEIVEKLYRTAEYLSKACPDKTNFLKRVHIPMIFNTSLKAQDQGIDPAIFYEWLKKFFKDNSLKKATKYANACQSGSAKYDLVVTRLREMDKHYDNNIANITLPDPDEVMEEVKKPVKKTTKAKDKGEDEKDLVRRPTKSNRKK